MRKQVNEIVKIITKYLPKKIKVLTTNKLTKKYVYSSSKCRTW